MTSLVPKSDFFGLEEVVHLAAGGETPFLKSHLKALHRFAIDKSEGMPGRERFVELADRARHKVARLMGCHAEDIGFPQSVAHGVNQITNSLDLKPGDNVVIERWEFPSVLYPLLRLREQGVEVRLLEPTAEAFRVPLTRMQQLVDDRTRLLAISQVSYFTGERHDLEAYSLVARAVGALFVVDATHALGVVPVYAPHADFLFSACYKWILGTHGVAIAYWNRARQPDWRPRDVGWSNVQWEIAQQRGATVRQVTQGRIFEPGNPSFIGLTVLDNALNYIGGIGIDRIERHVLALSGELRHRLLEVGVDPLTPEEPAARAGNVSFEVDDEERWREELEAHEVLTWTSDSRVRMSVHLYNDLSDVERGVRAVTGTYAKVGPRTGARVPGHRPR